MPRKRRTDRPLPGRLMRFWWRFAVVGIIVYVGYTIWLGGAYRSVDAFTAGQCVAVPAPPGPEDMAVLPDGPGLLPGAIVSSQDRRDRAAPGGLYFYDLSSRPGTFTRLETPASMVLHPHGLSLFTTPDGQSFLHVINHRSRDRHTVEIFAVQQTPGNIPVLRHRGSVASDLFVHPNGIAAAGPESFYLTNDRGSGPGWMHMVENLLQLSRSTVVYHDGRGARVVADNIAFANGIEISADGGTVLVGSTQWRMILAYTREITSGMLLRSGSLALPGGADNIRRDANGELWVAAHANAFAFIGHAMNAEKESPSMILRLSRNARGAIQTSEAFGDPGDMLSGASVGVQHQGRLLIGAVFQPTVLDCQLDEAKLREIES
ncbi:SMP-30/gluconolactonase/LRE family protein [Ferrovibrio terrae]|uniref:SMP-30/gluconolactonase/LRE family protein n=1 Tax=Ferrovibrio terrae TaxID=2594003 RepID=UPI0031377457